MESINTSLSHSLYSVMADQAEQSTAEYSPRPYILMTVPHWQKEQQMVLRSHHSLHCTCMLFQALSRGPAKHCPWGQGCPPSPPQAEGRQQWVWDKRLQKPHNELLGSLWEHLPVSPFKPAGVPALAPGLYCLQTPGGPWALG